MSSQKTNNEGENKVSTNTLVLEIVGPAPESPTKQSKSLEAPDQTSPHQSHTEASPANLASPANTAGRERTLWGKTVAPAASIFLTIGGIAGVVALLAFVVMSATNHHLLYVETGSMEPTVPTYSLVLAKDLEDVQQLEEGMILTVDSARYESHLTHRVTAVNAYEDTQAVIDHNRDVQERAEAAGITANTNAGIESAYGDTEGSELISYSVLTGQQSLLNEYSRGFVGTDDRTPEDFHIHAGSVGNENVAIIRMRGDANPVEDRYPYIVHEQNAMVYQGHLGFGGQVLRFLVENTTALLVFIVIVLTLSLLPIREFKPVNTADHQGPGKTKTAEPSTPTPSTPTTNRKED